MRDELGNHENDGLAAILADYLTRIDRGEPVCPARFMAEHPAHAAALKDYFADVELIERLAAGGDSSAAPLSWDDYELVEEIGRGGMGIVYRAREHATGRSVALKMLLHGQFHSPSEARRFRNETRTAAVLSHHGIVPIYHVGVHEGRIFYTMPLVGGGNLAQRLSAGPLAPGAAAQLLLAMAEAVAHAHSRGVVHRDLKPANILLDELGCPLVADFGLARLAGEEALGVTQTGDLLGTPNYMAPEQVLGHHAEVGPSADVYALGAMLYALLAGYPPFQSSSVAETLQRIGSAEPMSLRRLRRGVPRDLETIALQCLEKSPAMRYGSAALLADELRRYLAGEPLLAQRISQLERGRRWFARNRVVGTLATAVAAALLGGMGFSLHYAGQARQREQLALASRYAADMLLAQQQLRSGDLDHVQRLVDRHRPPPGGVERGDWEWRRLEQQCQGQLRQFAGPTDPLHAVAASSDGRLVAAAGDDKTVWLWDTAAGRMRQRLAGSEGALRALAFAPDGQRLAAVGDDGRALVYDTESGALMATLSVHEGPLSTVAYSADGSLLATGESAAANVILWDAATGAQRQSLDLGPAERLAFAPGDARLAIAGRDGAVRVCRPDAEGSWRVVATIDAHADAVRDVAWSPDGAFLATASSDFLVKLWDARSWRLKQTIGPFQEAVHAIRFRGDGRQLAVAARGQPIQVWDLDESRVVTLLAGHTGFVTAIDYVGAGWRLVSASDDGTVRQWDSAMATDHDRLDGHQGQVRAIAFSPDGKLLASAGSQDSAVIFWNPETCQPVRVLRFSPSQISDLAFSPDGKRMAYVMSGGEGSGRLRVWDVAANRGTLDLPLDLGPLAGLAWSPAGDRLAVRANSGNNYLVEHSGAAGRLLARWQSAPGANGSIAFSSDGTRIVTAGGDNVVRIWDAASQQLVRELGGHAATTVGALFNPQGTLVASSSNDHTIRLWDAATGRLLQTFRGHGGTTFGPAFSPDGARLASGSTDQAVKLWDLATGFELQSLAGHEYWARDVAFSPDGRHLASAGYDGSVRVWHAQQPDRAWAENREAAAVVRHLSADLTTRAALEAAIESDRSISDRVRAAALRQAEETLLHWPLLLAGHRAAERGEWATAVDAFDRVAAFAPDDAMHWHWLAMAALAAERQEIHQRACDELLHRFGPQASPSELFEIARACLATPLDEHAYKQVGLLVEAFSRHHPECSTIPWLYALRVDRSPSGARGAERPLVQVTQPGDWYVLALAQLQAGDAVRARAAYAAGARQARSQFGAWAGTVYEATLQREVQRLLAAAGAPIDAAPTSATPDPAVGSDDAAIGLPPAAVSVPAEQ